MYLLKSQIHVHKQTMKHDSQELQFHKAYLRQLKNITHIFIKRNQERSTKDPYSETLVFPNICWSSILSMCTGTFPGTHIFFNWSFSNPGLRSKRSAYSGSSLVPFFIPQAHS